jgi:predicted ATP-binding protein involved in virulence
LTDNPLTDSKKLNEFMPLKRLVLPELGELDASGLTIFVGPNTSGKTKLLREPSKILRHANHP